MAAALNEGSGGSTMASRLRQLMINLQQRCSASSSVYGTANICRISAWSLNFCGLFVFFFSLCALESKVNSKSTGLLWWTLVFHSAVCALWLARCSGIASAIEVDLNPLRYISGTLLMVSCDRAMQLQSAQIDSAGNAVNGVLAGAIITLLGYLPLLVDPCSLPCDDKSQRRTPKSSKSRSPRFHDTGLHLPDMSTMEEGHSTAMTDSGMPSFKSYSNPYAIEEEPSMEHIQPALMPHGGYPRPPKDLPPSPPPAARVCKAGQGDGKVDQAGSKKQPSTPSGKADSKLPASQTRTTTFAPTTTDLEASKQANPPLSASQKTKKTSQRDDSAAEGVQAGANAGITVKLSEEPDAVTVEDHHDTAHAQSKLEDTDLKAEKQAESQSRPDIKTAGSVSSPRGMRGSSGAPAYAKLPSVSLGTGVRAAGFLNQGDSEDSDA